MKHATPAEIRAEIQRALTDDFKRNGYDGPEPFIPARTFNLIEDAITRAEDKAKEAA